MILLNRADLTGIVIVTATEKAVVPITSFTLSFRSSVTDNVVEYVGLNDSSPAPSRYNRFEIDMSLFASEDNGFYTYSVTDQDGNELELGKMKLEGDTPVTTQYQDTPTEYTTYGQ